MRYRLLALLGSIAHGIRQFFASILSLVGLRALARFVVPALIAALALASVVSARDTAAILESRPDVSRTTLADVAARTGDTGGSIWFEFDALFDETSLAVPSDLGTFFYVARDPEDPSTGLLVRSPLNDAFIRTRVLSARLVDDPDAVSAAVEALGSIPSGFDLDDARYLEELDAGGNPEDAFLPSQLDDEEPGTELLVSGRVVSPADFGACATDSCDGDDAAWLYLFADPEGSSATILRSPHPPNAIPVRLQGLFQRDTFDLAPVLESEWFTTLDADVPTERAFSAGRRPPITVPASWVPTGVFAGLGLLLLASLLAGYPVFGRVAAPAAGRRLATGEGIDVEISGRLGRERGAVTLDRSPGSLERISIPELALRMWRYGMLPRDLSRREAEERFIGEAAGETDRLVVHERDQSALVTLAADAARDARVDAGHLYRLAGRRPAVHLRTGATDAYLTTATAEERDAVAAEMLGATGRTDPASGATAAEGHSTG
jgi:hypothetical protein